MIIKIYSQAILNMFKFITAPFRPALSLKLTSFFSFPKHEMLAMPALSPTMTEGKIIKWLVKEGDKVEPGDAIAEIQTDKATMAFEVQEKGFIAKINQDTGFIPIGNAVALLTKKKDEVQQFSSYKFGAPQASGQTSAEKPPSSSAETPAPAAGSNSSAVQDSSTPVNSRMASSPLAKAFALRHGVDLSEVKGSGPGGRIIKQDVDDRLNAPKKVTAPSQTIKAATIAEEPQQKVEKKVSQKRPPLPENPYESIELTGMRKTIAKRLCESKQTIPHYYVTQSIEMDAVNALRSQFNQREKENGVKISVNDIILKAMALALRDVPDANVQWHDTTIRRFKHSDISVAVAVEGGLITPVVSRAETLGLIQLAKKTKDIVKRAREGKLDPSEYIGGTSTISNLGMYGINTVSSIINPPQSTILGVGKTEARVLPFQGPERIRIAQVMDVIASCDHRAVDGALCSQWLNRIKFYLQNPVNMLL